MKIPRRRTLSDAMAASANAPLDHTFGFEAGEAHSDADAGRCGILVRVSPQLRRKLKLTAIARDTTVQNLMLEAIVMALQDPGRGR
jgi:hypothetical protein